MVKKVFEANKIGDKEKVNLLVDDLKKKISVLKGTQPPDSMRDYHNKLMNYYMAVNDAVDAILTQNVDIKSVYTKKCYEVLIEYFKELKALLIEHGGNEGDIEALEQTIIPGLKEILIVEFSDLD